MKIKLLLLFIFSISLASAQDNNIYLTIGLQANLPERFFNPSIEKYNNKNAGFGVHTSTDWYYSDKLSFGIQLEYAVVIENYQTDDIGSFNIFSFTPKACCFFATNKIRPFAGAGFSTYHVLYHKPVLTIGIRPVIGISFFHFFYFSLEYNRLFPKIKVDPLVNGDFDNYYLAAKASFSIPVKK